MNLHKETCRLVPLRVLATDIRAALSEELLAGASGQTGFLDPEQAARFILDAQDDRTLAAHWKIAEGHYLYRTRFQFQVSQPGRQIVGQTLPAGHCKDDPTFGEVEINTGTVDGTVASVRQAGSADTADIGVSHQGCAEAGICYSAIEQTVRIELPAAASAGSGNSGALGGTDRTDSGR